MTKKDINRLVDEYMSKIGETSNVSSEDLARVRDQVTKAMRDMAHVAAHHVAETESLPS